MNLEDEILKELKLIREKLDKLDKNQQEIVMKLLNEILKFEISSSTDREGLIKKLAEKINDKTSWMEDLMKQMRLQVVAKKDELLLNILQQCTGRKIVTEADAKEMSFIHHELYPGREFLSYKGNLIGEMVTETKYDEDSNTFKYIQTFVPKNIITILKEEKRDLSNFNPVQKKEAKWPL